MVSRAISESFRRLSESLQVPWQDLVQCERLTGFGSIATNTYATAARTSDGSLVMAYMPIYPHYHRRHVQTGWINDCTLVRPDERQVCGCNRLAICKLGRQAVHSSGNNSAGRWRLGLGARGFGLAVRPPRNIFVRSKQRHQTKVAAAAACPSTPTAMLLISTPTKTRSTAAEQIYRPTFLKWPQSMV